MSTDTREALAALKSAVDEAAYWLAPMTGGRSEVLAARGLRAAFDALTAALATQPAQPSAQTGSTVGVEPRGTTLQMPSLCSPSVLLSAQPSAQGEAECERSRQINMDRDRLWEENGIPAAQPEPSAQGGAVAVPKGWKLVPLDPTYEQEIAGPPIDGAGRYTRRLLYQAMLAAAPAAPAQAVPLTFDEWWFQEETVNALECAKTVQDECRIAWNAARGIKATKEKTDE